jgi:MFS family permease
MSPQLSVLPAPPLQRKTAFVAAVLLCVLLNPLNSSTLSVALPTIIHVLHTTTSGITWIVSGFYLGSAIAQPVMGKMGDIWGRSQFVYAGLLLTLITAICAPLSHSLWVFVLWRFIQAIGTSMVYPNAIGLLREHRSQDVGRILGWIGTTVGIALAIGPTLGGFLLDYISWDAIFWLNIPVTLCAAIFFYISLSSIKKDTSSKTLPSSHQHLDWWGTLLFVVAVSCLLFWSNGSGYFHSPQVYLLLSGGLLTTLLVFVELRQKAPILPVRWFLHRQFTLSSAITLLTNLVMYCILYGLPVYMEVARHYSASKSGLLLLAFAGVLSLASPVAGKLAQGNSRKVPLLVSGALLLSGAVLLCRIESLSVGFIILALAWIGISFAISNVVIQQMVLESAPKADSGQASGVYTLFRYLGTMISSVLISGSIKNAGGGRHLFLLLSLVSLVSLGLTWGLQSSKQIRAGRGGSTTDGQSVE